MKRRLQIFLSLWLACAGAVSASTLEDFPDGTAVPTAAELLQRLAGKSFTVQLKNGVSWRLQYNKRGYFFVDTSTGRHVSGSWHVGDGSLCTQVKGRDDTPQCSEARVHQDRLIVRRTVDGELITFEPR